MSDILAAVQSSDVFKWYQKAWRLTRGRTYGVGRIGFGLWAVACIEWASWRMIGDPFGREDDAHVIAMNMWSSAPLRALALDAVFALLTAILLVGILSCLWEASTTRRPNLDNVHQGLTDLRRTLPLMLLLLAFRVERGLLGVPTAEMLQSLPVWAIVAYALASIPLSVWLTLALCDFAVPGASVIRSLTSAWSLMVTNFKTMLSMMAAEIALALIPLVILVTWGLLYKLGIDSPWAQIPLLSAALISGAFIGGATWMAWLYAYRSMALKAGLIRVKRRVPAQTAAGG